MAGFRSRLEVGVIYPTVAAVSHTQFCESKLNTVRGVHACTHGFRALSQCMYLCGSEWGNMVMPWSTLSCVHGLDEVCTSGVHVCLAWLHSILEEQLATHAWPHTSQWMYLVLSFGKAKKNWWLIRDWGVQGFVTSDPREIFSTSVIGVDPQASVPYQYTMNFIYKFYWLIIVKRHIGSISVI